MNYYYLAASLPTLTMDDPPRISSPDFRAQCAEHLTRSDLDAVEAVWDESAPVTHPALLAWTGYDTEIRNAVARVRARHRQVDVSPYLREHEDIDGTIEKGVSDAFTSATPLERERAIDSLRWRILEDLGGLNEFHGTALISYALKLRISERWAAMDPEQGEQRAESLMRPRDASATTETTNAEGKAEAESAPSANAA